MKPANKCTHDLIPAAAATIGVWISLRSEANRAASFIDAISTQNQMNLRTTEDQLFTIH